ncbi:T9SS type A sorting domain-containing protein [Chryseobacterium sp. KMC2]|uniref:T9SS type A sorting domain-containing protein n=1 Tax=Chryseobacterium sp. KMC2 TaxID=2800705 RepID=UPI001922DCCF|nr:T9SS type A sorting domain-containing protein [Chryseobacterium sp. KMC2]MBL3549017.1 T9SS type A sorting domain-containing protein [Chryseobacterium sp. KMC2]
MIKKILMFTVLFWNFFSFAQEIKPVARKIHEYEKLNYRAPRYGLFDVKNLDNLVDLKKIAPDATVFNLNVPKLMRLLAESPEFLEVSFPFDGDKEITVQLYKKQIFTADFKVKTKKDELVPYHPGIYYRGIVKGDDQSIVSFSFFDNDVVGIVSTPALGNIVLGKMKNSSDFVSYSESKLTVQNSFICGADELKENKIQKTAPDPGQLTRRTMTDNCVRIFYEVGYKPYQGNGSNITATINWMTAIHNSLETIYFNDDIKVSLSEMYVWTTPDPYTGNYDPDLGVFRNGRPYFNGDIAQLVTSPTATGYAYINSLCSDLKYCYAPVQINYQQFPMYSWTVNVTTHEMGHGLGSQHTHACVWNGNNTAIDGCGTQSGNQGNACAGPIPGSGGGTIMSYCHLVAGVGINFANGFGPQPAEFIRNTINSKACLGTNCTSSCEVTVLDVSITDITQNSASAFIIDGFSSTWKYRLSKMDGTIVQSGTVNSNSFNINNLDPNTYYNLSVGSECSGSSAYQKYRTFLTDGDWCAGARFTDSGGASGRYSNNEKLTKTFYPLSNSKLTLVFSEFNLENFKDYMYVYNGPSAGSPLFPNGNNLTGTLPPGPFVSTDPTGAITVEFFSNESGTGNGWNAGFLCKFLGVEDIAVKDNTISIYPNPAKTMIIISSKENLKSYKIFDEAGRLVSSASSLKGNKAEVHLSSIQTGNYVISIETEKQTVNKKLIKQ